jgi:RNA recognition motif-containing protein
LQQGSVHSDATEKTIYVTNIDSQITEDQLYDFFNSYAHVDKYKLCGDTSHPTRFAFVEFSTREGAIEALQLNNSQIGAYNIKISPSRTAISNGSNRNGGLSQHRNSHRPARESRSNSFNNSTPQHQEQVGRTVYVGNVDISITEDELQEFFHETCGPVSKVSLAGDSEHSARFAFIEFANTEARDKALTKSGVMLGNRIIRVNISRTPILGGGKTYSPESQTTYSNTPGTEKENNSQNGVIPNTVKRKREENEENNNYYDPNAIYSKTKRAKISDDDTNSSENGEEYDEYK